VAHPLSGQLAPQFPGPPVVARALALLAIYAAVSGGIFLCAWAVRATLRRMKFEAFDRHLGMILGGLEGGLLGLVGTLFVISLLPQTRGPIFASPTGRVACQVMDAVGPVLPAEVRGVLAPFLEPVATEPVLAAPAPDDPSVTRVRGLIEEGENRVGRALVDSAAKELERRGGSYGRTFERR